MTNHDRFVEVFKERGGQVFTTREIEKLMEEESDIIPGSIRPNDHSNVGNKSDCKCARTGSRIFDKLQQGKYRVRRNIQKVQR
jgi:hypothetical protein